MRRSLGKIRIKSSLLSIVFGALALSLTGCTSMLIHEAQWPDFTSPQPGKATCVVIRRSSNMSSNFIPIYRDSEYVGGTGDHDGTVFSFPVEPGEHYIVADAANMSIARFNFRAGKTYYLIQSSFSVPYAGNFSTFAPVNGSDATTILQEEKGKSTWVQANPAKPHENLSIEDQERTRKDYEEWSTKAENAESFKTEKEYPGY